MAQIDPLHSCFGFDYPYPRTNTAQVRRAHYPKVLFSELSFAIFSLFRLSLLVERKTLARVVVGLSPTVGGLFIFPRVPTRSKCSVRDDYSFPPSSYDRAQVNLSSSRAFENLGRSYYGVFPCFFVLGLQASTITSPRVQLLCHC